ncbi:MAG: thioredoxin domain-containing protein [Anaerolineales bacterium]|nr:thioredoxin domain-containing protein [Anaerolineales bacterium]
MATGAARLIEENYIEGGKVRYEYYYVAFNQPAAKLAAEAAECANSQGAFWPYHDIIYANQTGRNDQYSERRLLAFAAEINLDGDSFRSCLRGGNSRRVVQQDTDLASKMGVQSTPTVFINGDKVEGSQSFEVYRELIERKLAQSQS